MKTVQEILAASTDFLRKKGVPRPRRLAEELLSGALDVKRLDVYLQFDRPLVEKEINYCREGLARLAKREPWQYVIGEVEFYDCSIRVSNKALIPRQETEILVDLIVQQLSSQALKDKVLWDICCGTGCIGIALKKRFPELQVTLVDISPEALSLAQENAVLNKVKVELLQGDLLDPLVGRKGDFIVCNPPYIAEHEYKSLEPEVFHFEPRLALIGGASGLEFYERMAQQLKGRLNFQGWFEMGNGQKEGVERCFKEKGWLNYRFEKDWSGDDRFFFLESE